MDVRKLGLNIQVLASGLSHRTVAWTIKALVSELGDIVIVCLIPGWVVWICSNSIGTIIGQDSREN